MSAIDHASNGLFDNGATTKWKRGSNVEVVRRGTRHGGKLEVRFGFACILFKLLSSHIHIISYQFLILLYDYYIFIDRN